jgi:hypothetical protein
VADAASIGALPEPRGLSPRDAAVGSESGLSTKDIRRTSAPPGVQHSTSSTRVSMQTCEGMNWINAAALRPLLPFTFPLLPSAQRPESPLAAATRWDKPSGS